MERILYNINNIKGNVYKLKLLLFIFMKNLRTRENAYIIIYNYIIYILRGG